MKEALLYSAYRFFFLLVAFCLVLSFAQRVAGLVFLKPKKQRWARRIQEVLAAIALVGFLLEAHGLISLARRGVALPDPAAGVILGFSAWALISWVALIGAIVAGLLVFSLMHWPVFENIREKVKEAEEDETKMPSAAELCEMHETAKRFEQILPPGFVWLSQRLQSRIEALLPYESEESITERALSLLAANRPSEALGWVMRIDSLSREALVLAMDTHNWRLCNDQLDSQEMDSIAVEAAQLMADQSGTDEYRALGIDYLKGEENCRRCASIELRRGRDEEARAILAEDWEARMWIQEEQEGE